jgi:hypothetical protein
MIRVKVSLPGQDSVDYTFEENIITIGSSSEQNIVLSAEDELVFPEHLKIIKEEEGYSLLNLQEDAGTILNNEGFSQSLLSRGDIVKVGPIEILFEEISLGKPEEDSQSSADSADEAPLDELEEAEKLLEEAEASLSEENPSEDSVDLEEKEETVEDDLEKLLADIDLSKEDLSSLQEDSMDKVEDLELDIDLTQIRDLLDDDELAELSLEKETEKTFEASPEKVHPDSPELSDAELEQMLLEIHGDEKSKEDYKNNETGALLSSLKEKDETKRDLDLDLLDIEFLDDEDHTEKAEETEAKQEKTEAVAKEEEEEEEREIPLGSIKQTYEDFGEYTPEKGTLLQETLEKEQKDKATLVNVNRKQIASIAAVYIIALFLLGLGTFITYSSVNSSNDNYSRLATRGLADFSMALSHNNMTPGSAKVSDSLRAVLPPQYLNSSEIYHTGTFKRTPYSLYQYYNDSRSTFLLVAEPKSGILQRIVPKDTLVIDSETMIIRKTKKLKDLTALLSTGENNLSLIDRSELEATLDTFSLVTPKDLEENFQGFAPPAELAQLFPSSELHIYNSPRYYKFSQLLGKKVQEFSLNQDTLLAFQELSQHLSSFNEFKNIVLYFSAQETEAKKAYSLLKALYKRREFAVGHLFFNQESGRVKGANILTKDEVSEEIWQEAQNIATQINTLKDSKIENLKDVGINEILETKGGLNFNSHPIYEEISVAIQNREDELEEVSASILNLLKKNNKSFSGDFEKEHLELNNTYKEANIESKKHLSDNLRKIFDEQVSPNTRENLPIFLTAIEENELEDFLPDAIKERVEFIRKKRTSKKDIDYLVLEIENSKKFQELHNLVIEMEKMLKPEFFDKATSFLTVKNKFKATVLNKIKTFILDSDSYDHNNALKREDRKLLENVLQIAEVNEGEELHFYLNEFDRLVEQFYSLPKKEVLAKLEASSKELVSNLKKDVFISEHQKKLIKQQTSETEEQIKEQSEKVHKLQEQVSKVPLRSYQASTPEKQKVVSSRVGQQILVRESLEEPSNERDSHLLEALNLIQQGTHKNRSLWGDVLQIRNLLAQTPETQIIEIIYSDIGFDPKKAPLTSSIRKISKNYIEEKNKLAAVATDKSRYFANRNLFASTQKENLEKIVEISQETQKLVNSFNETLNSYIHKLENFSMDYQQAKDEGFFVKDQQYHAVMSSRLAIKLKRLRKIQDVFNPIISQITAAAQAHEELAQVELEELFTQAVVDSNNINFLTQKDNEITYPDLASINIAKQISELLKIKISPIR